MNKEKCLYQYSLHTCESDFSAETILPSWKNANVGKSNFYIYWTVIAQLLLGVEPSWIKKDL